MKITTGGTWERALNFKEELKPLFNHLRKLAKTFSRNVVQIGLGEKNMSRRIVFKPTDNRLIGKTENETICKQKQT